MGTNEIIKVQGWYLRIGCGFLKTFLCAIMLFVIKYGFTSFPTLTFSLSTYLFLSYFNGWDFHGNVAE